MSWWRRIRLAGASAIGLGAVLLGTPIRASAQPFLYVTNYHSNSVSVVNATTNAVVATIPVGLEPRRVAFTPDGLHAYVINHGSNTVSVIDTVSRSVSATIPIGRSPSWIVIRSDGRRVYVNDTSASMGAQVTVIDTALNAVIATLPFPGLAQGGGLLSSRGLAITPDGKRLFVGTNLPDGPSVSAVDTATNTVTGSYDSSGDGSFSLFLNPAGTRLWAAHQDLGIGGGAEVLDAATLTRVGDYPLPDRFVCDVAFAANGSRAYIAENDLLGGSRYFAVLDTATGVLLTELNEPMGEYSCGAAITPDGSRVYLTRAIANAVEVFDTGTNLPVGDIPVGLLPVGIAVQPIPGDLNHDGRADCLDVAIVKLSFGKRTGQPGFDARADVNRDGVVDVRDLAWVAQKLPAGTRCP
jgi:YVTN family beta-propeller protein